MKDKEFEIKQVKSKSKIDLLSVREREVALLVAKGYSNVQITDELYISVETVKRHLSTIFKKLEIESRKEISNALS